MQKTTRNKQVTGDSQGVKDKEFMFPGNPPVTVTAKNREEAEKKYKQLTSKK